MEVLLDYSWPGNVRQLESAIERAILLCDGDTITPRDLPQEVLARKSRRAGSSAARGGDRFEIPAGGHQLRAFRARSDYAGDGKSRLGDREGRQMLGMSYRTLQYRLDKFGIKKPDGRGCGRLGEAVCGGQNR